MQLQNLCSLPFFKAIYFESSQKGANYPLYKIRLDDNEVVGDPISIVNVILPMIPDLVDFAFLLLFGVLCFNFHSNYYVTCRVLRVGWGKTLNSTRLVKFNHTFLVLWFMGFFVCFEGWWWRIVSFNKAIFKISEGFLYLKYYT